MPNPSYEEFPLTFEKGLTTEFEDSTLEPGQAAELENWVPSPNGVLRARNSWRTISKNGLPAGYSTRGWGTVAAVVEGSPGSGGSTTEVVQYITAPETPNGSGWFDAATSAVQANPLTLTLNGTVAGNLLVAIFVTEDLTVNEPGVGWTEIAGGAGEPTQDAGVRIFTKVSGGGTESATMEASTAVIYGAGLWELSGVEETPDSTAIATFSGTGTGGGSMTANPTSANGGIAFGALLNAAGSLGFTAFSGTSGFDESARHEVNNAPGGGWAMIDQTVYTGAGTATASYSFDGATGTIKLVCFAGDSTPPGPATPDSIDYYIVVALTTATGYAVYWILRDEIETGTWELIDSATVDDTDALVTFAQGSGKLVWSSTTMSEPRSLLLSADPPTPAAITDMTNKAGRALAYHKDRLFSGGDASDVSRLYFSAIADPTSFTTATDYIDVGGDDGEPIQEILSVEGLLLVCKSSRLYLISGSGIESFFVNELPGGSAASGRSAVRTPYGTIVVGLDDIWVVQGGGVDPLSRPLGAEFMITGNAQTAYSQDSALIGDTATGTVYRFNLVTGAWMKEVVEGENKVFTLFSLHGRLYYGTNDSDTQLGGTRKLSTRRNYDLTTGGTSFLGSTGKVALLGPAFTYTPQYLFLQLRNQLPTDGPNTLRVQIETNVSTENYSELVEDEVQRTRLPIGRAKGVEWLQVRLEADSSAEHPAIDVESMVLGVIAEGGEGTR